MLYGNVISWNPRKGFGFIRPDRGPDIFFHVSAIGACQELVHIEIGQPVQYEVDPKTLPKRVKRGEEEEQPATAPVAPRALMVELIERIPGAFLGEQVDETVRVAHHPQARRKKPTWRK